MEPNRIIGPHGGYRDLNAFKTAEIVYDATVAFCNRCFDSRTRTIDQMVQAARSGKQNIAEGSRAAATSNATEIRLTAVARASLEELLLDFEDYLRQNRLELWEKDHPKAAFIRKLATSNERSYATYKTYIEAKSPETAANTVICLIHQANFLLDRLIRSLELKFAEEGGFTERLHNVRAATRTKQRQ